MRQMFVWLLISMLFFQCQEQELITPITTQQADASSRTEATATNSFYVSITGSDAGDGSITRPWRSLRYAVTKVPPNQDYHIVLSEGTFVENGLIEVPLGVSIVGAGIDKTILKAVSSFYYYPTTPAYATDKFLISLNEITQLNGNQSLSGFTIDGDAKKLHGGIYVRHRNNVTIEDVKVQNTNFTGIWLWDVKDSKLINTQLIDCSWGSSSYCSAALNIGNLENVEMDRLNVNESTGYGIKAIGPGGSNNILKLNIHDSRVSVHPYGMWNNGQAPNIAIELVQVNLVGSQIQNSYVDNTISLINNGSATPSTGVQTIRVHHNIIDIDTRAKGAGYGVELTVHDAEIDHNYFIKGSYGIVNWDRPMKNWSIHHNTFFALQNTYPGDVVRSQWSGLHNVKLYNNTIEFVGTQTMNVVGAYGGVSENVDIKNNLFIDNNTSYSYYPNQLVHLENGATLTGLNVMNNSFSRLPIGTVTGIYSNNLTSDPLITKTNPRPSTYYMPKAGSPLINGGLNVGHTFEGTAPDIGAFEYNSVANTLPTVSISSPLSNATFTAGSAITIVANAVDNDGTISKVEFYNGNTLLGQDVSSPYSLSWVNVAAGTYALTAKAYDNLNVSSVSTAINITVGNANKAPVVAITSPLNNATFTAGTSVTITATASDSDGTISKVEFYNGTTLLAQDASSPYSISWINVAAGTYPLTAKVYDNLNASAVSTVTNITVNPVNKAPTITITSPFNNAIIMAGTSFALTANAADSDGTISKVEFYNGTTLLGQDVSSPYSFYWTNVVAGTYLLTAKAYDNLNATTVSAMVRITVSNGNNAPAVALTSPLDNTSFITGDIVSLTANAKDSDGTIARVEFYNGTVKLGEDSSSPYNLSWTPAAGTYYISAKAIDNAGEATISNEAFISVTGSTAPLVEQANSGSIKTIMKVIY